MNINEKAAEILVACGYATHYQYLGYIAFIRKDVKMTGEFKVRPFEDDLEGRRQADAILTHFWSSGGDLDHIYEASDRCDDNPDRFQHRLARVKYCLEQLTEQDNA